MNSFGVRSMGGSVADGREPCRAPGAVRSTPLPASRLPLPAAFRFPLPVSRFTYSHMPSLPPSLPNPLSRYPPNPDDASNRFVELIHTTPALILGAMSSARLMLSVQTLAASPYGVLLASATLSSGVRNVIATSTGPKISTWAMVDEGCTSVNSVGG